MIYKGEYLNEISFPIGGIGTGSIGLAGNGSIIDWEIANKPRKGKVNPFTFFAIRAELEDGSVVTKVLQGDHTKDLTGQYLKGEVSGFGFSGFGHGPLNGTMCAFPHFKNVEFDGSFPIATLTFKDEGFPADVILHAYNPFIPHDAKNSSIPLAFFDIKIKNKSEDMRAKYIVAFSTKNPFDLGENFTSADGITSLTMKYSGKTSEEIDYGDITIATNAEKSLIQSCWYRGEWRDC